MVFDDTYTDREIQRNLRDADEQWIGQVVSREPDLNVDGMRRSLLSRLLGLFSPKSHSRG